MAYTTIDDVRGEEHIDSRDLIELADYMREALATDDDALDADERVEMTEGLAAIDELAESGIEDWPYGAHFIRRDCFEDYARELAEEIGAPELDRWPATCIDWEQAADALAMDYTSVTFLGHDYYVR